MGLEISVQASKDFLRIDKWDTNRANRLGEFVMDKKILQRDSRLIAELIANSITENIHKGKRYDTGGSVAALKASTIARKKRMKRANPSRVFLDSGKLFVDVIVKKIGRMFVIKLSDRKYKSGVSVAEVGEYLQLGNTNMKARPFFGINKKNLEIIVKKVFRNSRILK